jgi:hypothetical protein
MKKCLAKIRPDQPAVYVIKLQGRLGQEWSSTFGNMDIQTGSCENEAPITIMQGSVADQAALHGLLQQVRDLGLVLLEVRWVDC